MRMFCGILQNSSRIFKCRMTFIRLLCGKLKKEMISPKNKNEKVDPAVIARLFESIIYGGKYPVFLLETMVRRVKIDSGSEKN